MNKKDSIYYNSFIHSYKNKNGLGIPGSHGRPVFGVNPDNYFLGNHKDIFPNPNPSSELLSHMYGYNKEPGLYGRPSFGVNDDNFFSGKHIFPAPIQNTSNDNNEKNSSNFFGKGFRQGFGWGSEILYPIAISPSETISNSDYTLFVRQQEKEKKDKKNKKDKKEKKDKKQKNKK